MKMPKLKELKNGREIQDLFFLKTSLPGVYHIKIKLVSEAWLKNTSGGATTKGCIINNKTVCLNEDMEIYDGFAILLHELLHFILNTVYRSDVAGAFDKNRRMLFNLASDLQINDMVIKYEKFNFSNNHWFIKNQEGLLKETANRIGSTPEDIVKMSTEKIYGLLIKQMNLNDDNGEGNGDKGLSSPLNQSGENGQGNQDGNNNDSGNQDGKNPFENNSDELTEEQKKQIEKAFKELSDEVKDMLKKFGNGAVDLSSDEEKEKQKNESEANNNLPTDFLKDMVEFKDQLIKNIGNINGNWQREFNVAMGVKINWEKIISREVRSILRGYDDISFRKINVVAARAIKKHSNKNVILPSYISKKPGRLGIIIDTSASINQKNLDKFLTIVNNYLKHFKDVDARVISIDTKINTDQVVKKVEAIKCVGGGGTSLCEGIRALDEDKNITNMLIFTDGYCDFNYIPRNTKSTFIFDGVTPEEIKSYLPKYGRKIFI